MAVEPLMVSHSGRLVHGSLVVLPLVSDPLMLLTNF